MMDPALQAYFDAWNQRDGEALVAAFVPGGSYEDPATGGALSGADIAGYASRLWGAFPDLAFDVVAPPVRSGDQVAVQWRMQGTHTGPLNGLPPTGRRVSTLGSDFIRVQDGRIASVRGYFDSRDVPEQLGLQVIVQPDQIGPFSFGTAIRVHYGSTAVPGAWSITAIDIDPADTEEVREHAMQMATELKDAPGFIGTMLLACGDRRLTVSAWERPDNAQAAMKLPAHRAAMVDFYHAHGLARSGNFATAVPAHAAAMHVRCPQCGAMAARPPGVGQCNCGSALPADPPWW